MDPGFDISHLRENYMRGIAIGSPQPGAALLRELWGTSESHHPPYALYESMMEGRTGSNLGIPSSESSEFDFHAEQEKLRIQKEKYFKDCGPYEFYDDRKGVSGKGLTANRWQMRMSMGVDMLDCVALHGMEVFDMRTLKSPDEFNGRMIQCPCQLCSDCKNLVWVEYYAVMSIEDACCDMCKALGCMQHVGKDSIEYVD